MYVCVTLSTGVCVGCNGQGCCYTVTLYDGAYTTSAVLAVLSGYPQPSAYRSSGNYMLLVFSSTGDPAAVFSGGFQASVSSSVLFMSSSCPGPLRFSLAGVCRGMALLPELPSSGGGEGVCGGGGGVE